MARTRNICPAHRPAHAAALRALPGRGAHLRQATGAQTVVHRLGTQNIGRQYGYIGRQHNRGRIVESPGHFQQQGRAGQGGAVKEPQASASG